MIRTAVVGAAGKMGKTLIPLVAESAQLELVAALEQPGVPEIGKDAGLSAGVSEIGVLITDDLVPVASDVDVVIDFTVAKATVFNLEICARTGTPKVIATTGISSHAQDRQ